jgi:hypothetical protein
MRVRKGNKEMEWGRKTMDEGARTERKRKMEKSK